MLRKSFHGWRIKQEIQNLTGIRTPSPRLNPVRDSPTRPPPLTSLSPLPLLFSYCQKNLPPTSEFRFTRQTTRFPLSTGSVATGFSATAYYSCAPEPDSFTHVEDPNPNVDSLRESSVGVDDGREDRGEGFGCRRTQPEELSSTVVVLTCRSIAGTCDVFLLRQGLSREQVPVVRCLKSKEPFLQLWWVDVDMFESLMLNSKAVVNKLEVRRGDELRVAFEEARKYGGEVANKLEGYPRREFRAAKDDCAPIIDDFSLGLPLELSTKLMIPCFYGLEDNEDDEDKDNDYILAECSEDDVDGLVSQFEIQDQEMRKESPTLM